MIGGRLGIHNAVNDKGGERRNELSVGGVSPWWDDVIFSGADLILDAEVFFFFYPLLISVFNTRI